MCGDIYKPSHCGTTWPTSSANSWEEEVTTEVDTEDKGEVTYM